MALKECATTWVIIGFTIFAYALESFTSVLFIGFSCKPLPNYPSLSGCLVIFVFLPCMFEFWKIIKIS